MQLKGKAVIRHVRIALRDQSEEPVGVAHLQSALLKEHGILLSVHRLPGRRHKGHRADKQARVLVLRLFKEGRVLLLLPDLAKEACRPVHDVPFLFAEQCEGLARMLIRQDVQHLRVRLPAEELVRQAVKKQPVAEDELNGFSFFFRHVVFPLSVRIRTRATCVIRGTQTVCIPDIPP